MENNNKVLLAFGIGALTGALIGVLFAPDKGTATREKIRSAGVKLSDNIKDKLTKGKNKLESTREELMDKLDAVDEKIRELV